MFKFSQLWAYFVPTLHLDSGGGGSSGTSGGTSVQEIPEWARGYAKDTLAKGAALTDINQNPYKNYGQARIAGFSPMQQAAMQGAANIQTGPEAFQQGVTGYMNPYIKESLSPQIAEANRQYDISGQKQQGQATQAGAFGGGRDAIMRAENERNRNMGIQNIVGQGYNTAFQNAQNQYNTGFNQNIMTNQLQNQYGAQQQAQAQKGLDVGYQDFLNQQNYPYKQLGFMSDMIRGLPLGQQSTQEMYQSPGSVTGQIAGLGLGAYGMSQAFPSMFKAEGGEVNSYADGGSVDSTGNIESIVKRLSDEQLKQAMQAAQARGDQEELQAIQAELAMRASERGGMAGAFNSLPQESQENMTQMAGGGIVAFADGDLVTDPMGNVVSTDSRGSTDDRTIMEKLGIFNPENRRALEKAERSVAASKEPKAAAEEGNFGGKSTASFLNNLEAGNKKVEPAKSISDHPIVSQARAAAKAAGVPEEDFESKMKRLMKEYSSEDKGYQDEMLKHYKDAKSRLEENKRKAGYEALTQFGFGMAAQAAKPGQARRQGLAGLLESAGTASPILSQSMAESNKINEAAANNLDKMRMDQLRFDQSMLRNDRQAATQAAGLLQQDKKTEKLLELERQKIAMMGQQHALAGVSGIGKVVQELAQRDPEFAKLPGQEQYKIASQISGYSFRTDAANQGRLAESLRKIDEKFSMLGMLPPNDPMAVQMAAERDRQIAQAKQQFGGGQASQISGVTIPKGVTIEKLGG